MRIEREEALCFTPGRNSSLAKSGVKIKTRMYVCLMFVEDVGVANVPGNKRWARALARGTCVVLLLE